MPEASGTPAGKAQGLRPGPPPLRAFLVALARDRVTLLSLVFLVALVLAALFAEWVAPFDPTAQSLRTRLAPPLSPGPVAGGSWHLLGSDHLGRDLLSRLIHGARISLAIGFSGALVSGVFGVLMGLLAGYYRGKVDDLIMRVVDLQMAFPFLMLALFVLYAIGPGITNIVLVLAVARWPIYARLTRGMAFSLRETPFVEAARIVGCSHRRIMFRHILPNLLSPLVVLATLEIARLILAESTLSFLGLGIQPPQFSWGLMIAAGRDHIGSAWWLITFPGLFILLTALAANLLATWVRAITDPVQRWRWLIDARRAPAASAAA